MDPNTSDMNVKVAVRCRPLNEEEEKKGMNPVVACDTEKSSIKVSENFEVDFLQCCLKYLSFAFLSSVKYRYR